MSVVVVLPDVESAAGVEAGSVDAAGSVDVVVSVEVVVPVSELAAGGEPVSAAAGYARTPTPASVATRTAKRAAKRHSNRLSSSLRATILLSTSPRSCTLSRQPQSPFRHLSPCDNEAPAGEYTEEGAINKSQNPSLPSRAERVHYWGVVGPARG